MSAGAPDDAGAPGETIEPVTVTITNFDGREYLPACLDAVLALEAPVARVILVDNASRDDSVALVRRDFPRVEVVELARNEGPCPARNEGLRRARTRWVLQLDSDVLVAPDLLARLWPQTRIPGVVAVQPRAVLADDPGTIHYDGGTFHYVGVMCLPHLLAPAADAPTEPGDVDAVISMALLLEREVVLDAGGYDEAFFILFEDHDLSYRLRAAGHRLRRVPGAVVRHREGTRGISFRPGAPAYPARRAYLHARNRPYLILKNYGLAALVLTAPGRLVYTVAWAVFAVRKGVFGAVVRGWFDLVALLPRAWRLRRELARRRRVGDGRLLRCDPLTFSPVIRREGADAILEAALDRLLAGWWALVRRLLPSGRSSP